MELFSGKVRYAIVVALFLAPGCSSTPPPQAGRSHPAQAPASDPEAVASRISGDWQFALERGGRTIEGWLHFGLTAGELVGSLTGPEANPREISKIHLKGDKVSWEIAGEARTEHYEGTLKGSSMEGTLRIGPGKERRADGEEGSSRGGGGSSGGHRGGGGRGGGSGGRSSGSVGWKAYRSVQAAPAPVSPTPEPAKAPPESGERAWRGR